MSGERKTSEFGVTRIVHFCYGHRLLDYDGKCAHPHGHNGVAELTIEKQALDHRGMVVDFGDVKRRIGSWIDAELDHKMILRADDPLASILRQLGEPVYVMDENPTAENLAQLIFRKAKEMDLPLAEVKLWETPQSFATYREKARA